METELSFCELRRREVINGSDGKRLGHIIDLVFTVETGKLNGIILPYGKHGIFAKSQDLFVPWPCVQKIGEDVIIVELRGLNACGCAPEPPKPECTPACKDPPKKPKERDCDGKCEKCMLFDCSKRWEYI